MLRKMMLLVILLLIVAPVAAQNGVVWKAEYYDNSYLIGERAALRTEERVNFDWGLGSPSEHVSSNNFSARFTTDAYFPAGTYRFSALADDRVRVSVAFAPVIDTFERSQPGVLLSAEVSLPEGMHHLQVDYAEETREAYVSFDWARIDTMPDDPQLPVLLTSAPLVNPNPWVAAYYPNPTLSEPFQFKRDEPQGPARTFNTDAPRPDMPTDYFSVRWESVQPLADGTYQIRLRAKDGVRVYINGNRVIDAWGGSAGQLFTHTFSIAKGEYRFTVEYFKNTGLGYVDYNLVLLDSRPIDQLYTLPGSGPPANFQPPQGQPPSQVQVPADLPPTGYIVTAADNTNLRNGPGTQFDVIGTMPFQAEASVIARDPALIWWLVNYNGTIGWVSTRLARIQPTANINVIPVLG